MAKLAFYTCNRFLTFSSRSSKYLLTSSIFNLTRSIANIRLGSYHCHVPDIYIFFLVFFFVFLFSGLFTSILSKTFMIFIFLSTVVHGKSKITKIPLGLKTEILRTGFCHCKKNRYHQREKLCSRFMSCLVT